MLRAFGYRRAIPAWTFLVLALASACPKQDAEHPTDAVFDDFAKRVDAYLDIRKRSVATVGELDPTRSQAEIANRAAALGKSLVDARPGAKQGDIFTPDISAFLATLIKQEYDRRSEPVQETRGDQQDELPDFVPKVNMLYPTTYPLATFPPKLLPLLPALPEQLEYRIVGNYLILRDIEANLIVDFMEGADPSRGKSS
jgi:hypothetical protein